MNIDEENLKLATDIEMKDGSLGQNYYEGITNIVTKIHGEHAALALEGDKQGSGSKMAELNGTVAGVESIKETNRTLSSAIIGGDMSAWNDSEFTDDNKDLFNALMKGDTEISKSKEGDLGITFNGKFHSMNEIDTKIKDAKKDVVSHKDLRALVIGAVNLGKEEKGINETAKTNSFDRNSFKSQVRDVIKKGNIKSLIFDPILDGAPFVDSVAEMSELKQTTYKSLGLKPPKNDDDGFINETLTGADRKKIAVGLIDNPEVAQELLEEYFTRIIEQNNSEASGKEGVSESAGMSPSDLIEKYRNK